ncbi:Membrane attack complex component-perforin (MACPF) domain [Babesia duncani]|uniref:Membrane attack complex component-perforin (MACPF) domain n=1 Tax=Babesia duncani TaxID=323732 RepID=A0AAD9PP39_9APIC|nr:Membrane attack complex component-perforin (MACPF) domain [Babesia duncani]
MAKLNSYILYDMIALSVSGLALAISTNQSIQRILSDYSDDNEDHDISELPPQEENPNIIFKDGVEGMITNKDAIDAFDRGCPGLDYLGVGYDSIYANALGSDVTQLDPGYRAPIIEFEWRKGSQGYSPTLRSIIPANGWVRPVYSCARSTKIDEVETLEEVKNALSAGITLTTDIPSGAFTGSAGYKATAEDLASKKQNVYIHSDKCIRYEAGIPLNIPWKYTNGFKEFVIRLKSLENNTNDKCTLELFKEKSTDPNCIEMSKWISFFEMFGTHYTYKLTLGGKISQILKVDSNELAKMKASGINLETEISGEFGSVKVGTEIQKSNMKSTLDDISKKNVTVIGGKMPNLPITDDEFVTWAATVADGPMPIAIEAASIKDAIPEPFHKSFDIALKMYSNLTQYSNVTMDNITIEQDLFYLIKHGTNGLIANDDTSEKKCPTGSVVAFGILLLFNKYNRFLGIEYCESKRNDCKPGGDKRIHKTVTWLFCTQQIPLEITQYTFASATNETLLSVECPPNSVIQLGMKIQGNKGIINNIEGCENGEEKCSIRVEKEMDTFIWGVCHPRRNQTKIILKAKLVHEKDNLDCGEDYEILAEWRKKTSK